MVTSLVGIISSSLAIKILPKNTLSKKHCLFGLSFILFTEAIAVKFGYLNEKATKELYGIFVTIITIALLGYIGWKAAHKIIFFAEKSNKFANAVRKILFVTFGLITMFLIFPITSSVIPYIVLSIVAASITVGSNLFFYFMKPAVEENQSILYNNLVLKNGKLDNAKISLFSTKLNDIREARMEEMTEVIQDKLSSENQAHVDTHISETDNDITSDIIGYMGYS